MGILSGFLSKRAQSSIKEYSQLTEEEMRKRASLLSLFLNDPGQYFVDSATQWPPVDEAKKYVPTDMLKVWRP